jgi:hypothetical protein
MTPLITDHSRSAHTDHLLIPEATHMIEATADEPGGPRLEEVCSRPQASLPIHLLNLRNISDWLCRCEPWALSCYRRENSRSRPAPISGKAEANGIVRVNKFHPTCRGIGDGMYAKWTMRNTGSPSGDHRPADCSKGTSSDGIALFDSAMISWGSRTAHDYLQVGSSLGKALWLHQKFVSKRNA